MKRAEARLVGEQLRFEITSGSGHTLTVDDADGDAGPRPFELLLMSLAGCTAMDVISILRKRRQPVEAYRVEVSGLQREEHPATLEQAEIVHVVVGAVDAEAVRRAVELSATRYCSVGGTLASGMTRISHRYRLCRDGGQPEAEVVVTGPLGAVDVATPAALVEARA